jgi:hypothetical protein
MKINRRNCLKAGLAGAGFYAGAGLCKALGQDTCCETLAFTPGKSFSLNPNLPVPPDEMRLLGGYIHNYRLPDGLMEPDGGWTAVFDMLGFSATPEYEKNANTAAMSNEVMGQVSVSRPRGKTEYHIRMNFLPTRAVEDVMAVIRCNDDELASIRDYELVWNFKSDSQAGYTRREAGAVRPGELQILSESFTDSFKTGNPLTCLWTLFDAVRRLPAEAGSVRTADMYMDLSSLRRNQRIRFGGGGQVQTAAGTVPLKFYEQTGEGSPPIHYAVDEQQRTLFVTQGQLGWGLNRIARMS